MSQAAHARYRHLSEILIMKRDVNCRWGVPLNAIDGGLELPGAALNASAG